jgi:hypothetical protein
VALQRRSFFTEIVIDHSCWITSIESNVSNDGLHGKQTKQFFARNRLSSCSCRTNISTLDRYRVGKKKESYFSLIQLCHSDSLCFQCGTSIDQSNHSSRSLCSLSWQLFHKNREEKYHLEHLRRLDQCISMDSVQSESMVLRSVSLSTMFTKGSFRSQHESLHGSESVILAESVDPSVEIRSCLFVSIGDKFKCIDLHDQRITSEWFLFD